MVGIKSKVAITSDMWTSDNQREVTWPSQHTTYWWVLDFKKYYYEMSNLDLCTLVQFICSLIIISYNVCWSFLGFFKVLTLMKVIGDELYESLVDWNHDEKVSSINNHSWQLQYKWCSKFLILLGRLAKVSLWLMGNSCTCVVLLISLF